MISLTRYNYNRLIHDHDIHFSFKNDRNKNY